MLRSDDEEFKELDVSLLVGKTIQSINVVGGEDWQIKFTDGTIAVIVVLDNDDGSGQPILFNLTT